MASFALNYYFADGLKDSTPFKITNLVIHLLNTLLVFWFVSLILSRIRVRPNTLADGVSPPNNAVYLLAACVALVWSIHPIQLTSVLYIVQRMTELAATFTLLGLICYMHGREQILAKRKKIGLWLMLVGIVGGSALGILSKENAALLPLFVVLLELFLFQNELPWRSWGNFSAKKKWAIWMLMALAASIILLLVTMYALPRYENRDFTMFERLVSEARVIFFYLSLLFVPDISRLGHQHDDIIISSSLFIPWTTLPSLLGITALIIAGFWLSKRNPLLGLGILWFFAGHLMESTILPLELAHEHRNYLPSFGFALGVASVLARPALSEQRRRLIWVAYAAIVIAFAGTTYIRASQWSDHNTFYRYEITHHPQSARSQIGYSVLLEAQGHYQEAQEAVRQAATLDTHEAGYAMELLLLDARQKKTSNQADHAEVLRRLRDGKISATTILTLNRVDECLPKWCGSLLPYTEQWVEIILEKSDAPDPYYFQYRLGRIKAMQGKYLEALNLFQQAHDADKQFLHPLFEQIAIFLKLGQIQNAEYVLAKLKEANIQARYPRDREISRAETDINRLKKQANYK